MSKYKLITKENYPKGQTYSAVFEEIFSLAEESKKTPISLLEKIEILKKLNHLISNMDTSIKKFEPDQKLSFDPDVLDALCFYNYYSTWHVTEAKVPLFLTDYFKDARKFIDFTDIKWNNVSLSSYVKNSPDELQAFFKTLISEYRDGLRGEIFHFEDSNVGPPDFSKLLNGDVHFCNFSGLDLTKYCFDNLRGETLSRVTNPVKLTHCNFEGCTLTSKQIEHLFLETRQSYLYDFNLGDGPENFAINCTENITLPFDWRFATEGFLFDLGLGREDIYPFCKNLRISFSEEAVPSLEDSFPSTIEGWIAVDENKYIRALFRKEKVYDYFFDTRTIVGSKYRHFVSSLYVLYHLILFGSLDGCYLNGRLIENDKLAHDREKVINFLKDAMPVHLPDEFFDYMSKDGFKPRNRLKRLGLLPQIESLIEEYRKIYDKISKSIPNDMIWEFRDTHSIPFVDDYVHMSNEQRERLKNEIDTKIQQYTQETASKDQQENIVHKR